MLRHMGAPASAGTPLGACPPSSFAVAQTVSVLSKFSDHCRGIQLSILVAFHKASPFETPDNFSYLARRMPAQAGDLIHAARWPSFNGGQDQMVCLTHDIGLNGVMFQISFDPFGLAETHRRFGNGLYVDPVQLRLHGFDHGSAVGVICGYDGTRRNRIQVCTGPHTGQAIRRQDHAAAEPYLPTGLIDKAWHDFTQPLGYILRERVGFGAETIPSIRHNQPSSEGMTGGVMSYSPTAETGPRLTHRHRTRGNERRHCVHTAPELKRPGAMSYDISSSCL